MALEIDTAEHGAILLHEARGKLTVDLCNQIRSQLAERLTIGTRMRIENHYQAMDHFFNNLRVWLYRDAFDCNVFMVSSVFTGVLDR